MELRLDAGLCPRRSVLNLLFDLDVAPDAFAALLADFISPMQSMEAAEASRRDSRGI